MIPSVAFLAVEPASGERGGAEAFHDGFCDALARAGWQVYGAEELEGENLEPDSDGD